MARASGLQAGKCVWWKDSRFQGRRVKEAGAPGADELFRCSSTCAEALTGRMGPVNDLGSRRPGGCWAK
jgi:hypothetical protein